VVLSYTEKEEHMKVEEIIDYAWPCMCAEKALKQAHQAMLERDYVKAIENTNAAIDDCKAMLESIRTIASKAESLVRQ
jgi:poly(A) polymerase Pap1